MSDYYGYYSRDEWEEAQKHRTRHKANGSTPAITFTPFDAIRLDAGYQPYLVKGIIPKEGLVVLWGPPKSGKSFWALDICMHVALGWDYRGRKVHQGDVAYCSFEGEAGIKARIEAFRQQKLAEEVDPVPFHLHTKKMDLVKRADDLIASLQDSGLSPAIVVMDTLNRSLEGSENSDEDMGAYVKAADSIREAFNCAVIIIHHCGIQGTRPRGHTSLTGAADAQLACSRDRNNNVQVTIEWMKDGASEGEVIASKLTSVEVGLDADGEPVTSCVVAPVEAVQAEAQGKKLPKGQATLLGILREGMPTGLLTEEWQTKGKDEGIATTRKADFFDARRGLKDKGLIYTYNDRWFTR
jgi:hypothetical protein